MLHFYYLMFFPVPLKRPGLGAILLYNLVKLSKRQLLVADFIKWMKQGREESIFLSSFMYCWRVHKLHERFLRLSYLLFSEDRYC